MTTSITELLDRELPPRVAGLLRRCAELAAARGLALLLVGGTVRDLLLRRPPGDLDLVVEGDALALAADLAAALGGQVRKQTAFGTATLVFPGQEAGYVDQGAVSLDLAAARAERYERPAALPAVRPAALGDDLARRDFTINAMAVELTPARYGLLHDPFGGQADLAARRLRVLHDASLIDDPTRILRGVRLAARLGGALEPHTQALCRAALEGGMLEQTTAQRIANELRLLLREPAPERAVDLLAGLGALPHLGQGLLWTPVLAERFQTARAARFPDADLDQVYLGLLAYPLEPSAREGLIARYRPTAAVIRLLRDITALGGRLAGVDIAKLPDSELDRLLHPFGAVALRVAQLSEPEPLSGAVGRYLALLRPVQTALSGDDLRAMGVPQGPRLGALLAGLRAARLDGLLLSRADEEAWVRREFGG
jgi:tRNA nucleotidyltransferase (CCA-adding enzyme)